MAALWLLSRSSGFEAAALRRQPAAPLIFYFYIVARPGRTISIHTLPVSIFASCLRPCFAPRRAPSFSPLTLRLLPCPSVRLSPRPPPPPPHPPPRPRPGRARVPARRPTPRPPPRARLPAPRPFPCCAFLRALSAPSPRPPACASLPASPLPSPRWLSGFSSPPLENRPAVHCRGGVYNLLIKNASPRWTNRRHALSLSSYKVSPPASAGAG